MSAITDTTAERTRCDLCANYGSLTMREYDVRLCIRCARRYSVAETLERKYGYPRAQELLRP